MQGMVAVYSWEWGTQEEMYLYIDLFTEKIF